MTSLFVPLGGNRYRATELTEGPWYPGAQHGGPPAALLMRAVEGVESPEPMQVSRFTMEILGPVPVGDLDVTTRIVRPGRRVQLVSASLVHDGVEVVTATAWRIADRPGSSPPSAPIDIDVPPPDEGAAFSAEMPAWFGEGFHTRAVDKQLCSGSFAEPGPGVAWLRLAVAVVGDETPTPVQRVAAVADFANGLSAYLDLRNHLFINTDLTISFGRAPTGVWTLLDAASVVGSDGMGHSTSRLADTSGVFGHSLQSLLVAPR
jgi:hypothetical protein